MKRPNPPEAKPQSHTLDSAERRRLQNRQAQHKYRLREAAKAKQDQSITKAASVRRGRFLLIKPTKESFPVTKERPIPPLPCGAYFVFARNLLLSADHRLLTLVHNNIIRGLTANASFLNYPWSTICQDDALSNFSPPTPNLDLSITQSHLPVTLHPTSLQYEETHHPWLDLIPFPQFRDNLIRRLATASQEWDFETELCEDVTGVGRLQLSCSRPGFMIWGENSWDTHNWEVTEEFAQKWHDLMDGCCDLIASTNEWRKKRGEAPLSLKYSTTTASTNFSLLPE
ncbi:uncharacterized protein Triagg1_4265 [Trichoderma aggressivum f. europaeum]|uniref:BZIP domain-containing protein n=1 Tax=Trichoderma aggressivum f. europaeum TaxID=173218 RepID=A0AAE1IE01_9HYPO|nr:hypothetical protein Triagg1_4265 [Trichoderma aggressivum f. europaeum]